MFIARRQGQGVEREEPASIMQIIWNNIDKEQAEMLDLHANADVLESYVATSRSTTIPSLGGFSCFRSLAFKARTIHPHGACMQISEQISN